MKKYDAYLVGYYGMKNSGDDALMYATAWGAQNYFDVQKAIISSSYDMQIPEIGLIPH
jgi:polysaccharide pyruvyl transferase WcaK-like protein